MWKSLLAYPEIYVLERHREMMDILEEFIPWQLSGTPKERLEVFLQDAVKEGILKPHEYTELRRHVSSWLRKN
jgi:hypothetical protein